jgi:hypothetical protein
VKKRELEITVTAEEARLVVCLGTMSIRTCPLENIVLHYVDAEAVVAVLIFLHLWTNGMSCLHPAAARFALLK